MRVTLRFDALDSGGGYEWARLIEKGLQAAGATIQWKANRLKLPSVFQAPTLAPSHAPADVTIDNGTAVTHKDLSSCRTIRVIHGLVNTSFIRRSQADNFVAVSESVRRYEQGAQSSIDVIPNGIDLSRLPHPTELGEYFGYIGRNAPIKRLSFAREIASAARTRLLEVGHGTKGGYNPHPWRTINGCIQALLIPSLKEGLSLVACESACLGIPFYMTPRAAAVELRPYVTLCNSGNPADWAHTSPVVPDIDQARQVFDSARMVSQWVKYIMG